jgi:hypothetical protein
MGRPLRKLHQIHSVSPYGVDVCNIRTKNPQSTLMDLAAQRFVSKKDGIEKADHITICHGHPPKIRYHNTVCDKSSGAIPAASHLFVTFRKAKCQYSRLRAWFRHVLNFLFVSLKKKYAKTTLDWSTELG